MICSRFQDVKRRVAVSGLLLLFAASFAARPADAADIAVTGGSLVMAPSSGRLLLQGDRDLTVQAAVSAAAGVFDPYSVCNLVGGPCGPGDTLSLRGFWVGGDVRGAATLDGVSYPTLNGDAASVLVEFTGTVVLPALGQSAQVVAPFTFGGMFFHQGGSDRLVGSGVATVLLTASQGVPGRWQIAEVRYEMGGRLPAPWVSSDIGNTGIVGWASFRDDRFVISAAGSDVWGSADSFHFVHRSSANIVTARVLYQQRTHAFAKAGVMLRESLDASAANVILDLKPDGGIELMVRYVSGEPTIYVAGAVALGPGVHLRLQRAAGDRVIASQSANGTEWQEIGSVVVPFSTGELLGGLAVTSHDPARLNTALFEHVSATVAGSPGTLLTEGDFEGYAPPALGAPGWLSDHALRQVSAKSETHQPRSGTKNGACWTPLFLDCGMYQDVVAPAAGSYTARFHATSDRAGGLVGVNVNGSLAAFAAVEARGFGAYAAPYVMTVNVSAGDVVRLWMYSPATPGYLVIDDVSLEPASAPASTSN